jgi:hypothetical protein
MSEKFYLAKIIPSISLSDFKVTIQNHSLQPITFLRNVIASNELKVINGLIAVKKPMD